MKEQLISFLGIFGLIITVLVVVPASLLSFIKIFTHPIKEITNLWVSLVDAIFDILENIRFR